MPPAHLIASQPAIRTSLLKQDDARQHVNKIPRTVLVVQQGTTGGYLKQHIAHRI